VTTHTNELQNVEIAKTLMSISGPVFAAVRNDAASGGLIVHASRSGDWARLRNEILTRLSSEGVTDVKVQFHSPSKLARAKSLQAFVSSVSDGRIVYDPTGALARGRALVETSDALRASLGSRAKSFFYAPMLRSLVVVLRKPNVKAGETLAVADMAKIEASVVQAVKSAFSALEGAAPSVRVGFSTPKALLVPVDRMSVEGLIERIAHSAKTFWKPAAVAAVFGFGAVAPAAAQDPAVSEPNLKVRGSFGEVIDDFSWNVEGAFTAPLGERFGFAVEAGVAQQDDTGSWSTAGHLFARDPESYLIGLFAAYAEGNEFDIDATRVGGEFELYMDDVTLSGHAGYQFSSSLGDKAVGGIDFKWYADQNFAISAGAFGDEDATYGRGRLEWQPGFAALPGLAFNVDGVIGEDDYHSVMGGLTYYFGTPVSLKDRHRRQDPESALFGILQAVQQEQLKLAAQYGGPPPLD
jgi:hypothetical protein